MLTSALFYVPLIFADSEKCWLGGSTWLQLDLSVHVYFIVPTLIVEVLCEELIIHTAVQPTEHDWKQE